MFVGAFRMHGIRACWHRGPRLSRFIVFGDGDADDFRDGEGSQETPRIYRAAIVGWVAAAALQLFVQSNWTGPQW